MARQKERDGAAMGVQPTLAVGVWEFVGASRSAALAAPAVAVLPFDDLGGDEQANRLADGMTADVITDLARYNGVPGRRRNSTMTYKGRSVDARQVFA